MKIDDNDLLNILINPKLNSRGQYICDCPFCGKEKHFYISKKTQLWDCKKCGESGSIYKLLKFFDKTFLLSGSSVEEKDEVNSIRQLRKRISNDFTPTDEELPILRLPIGFKVVYDDYLNGRGLSLEECNYYHIGKTNLINRLKKYIIIPVYDCGEVRGWVGRYCGKNVPEGMLRYSNSKGTNFSKLLFGYDDIDKDETNTVILVEGIFDKIAVDRYLDLREQKLIKCVCTFGKKISNEQIMKLVNKNVCRIILLYDFDAVRDIKRVSVELEKYFFTSIVFTTKKDIDECTKEEALSVFSRLYSPMEFNENIIGKLKR